MSVRWYSIVVDCRDHRAQARWWAEALGRQVIYEDDDEAEVGTEPAGGGEPTMSFLPVGSDKTVKNRLHIDLAPRSGDDQAAEVARLEGLGARRIDVGQGPEVSWVVMADPEGNEFCVLSPRD